MSKGPDQPKEPETKQKGGKYFSPIQKNVLAGGIGASLSRIVCQPLDIAKIRMQVYPNRYRNMFHAMRDVFQTDGILGFWKGFLITQAYGISQGACQFAIFGLADTMLKKIEYLKTRQTERAFYAGFLTGSLSIYIVSPLELLKTNLVARDKKRGSAFRIAQKILKKEGVRGIYKGSLTAAMQVGPLIASRFFIYTWMLKHAIEIMGVKHKSELPSLVVLFIGGASGAASNATVYPMDVIKRRIHVSGSQGVADSCKKITECMMNIFRREGIMGFYVGMMPTSMKCSLQVAFTFFGYEKAKHMLNKINGDI